MSGIDHSCRKIDPLWKAHLGSQFNSSNPKYWEAFGKSGEVVGEARKRLGNQVEEILKVSGSIWRNSLEAIQDKEFFFFFNRNPMNKTFLQGIQY